jgi:hypothetical protein
MRSWFSWPGIVTRARGTLRVRRVVAMGVPALLLIARASDAQEAPGAATPRAAVEAAFDAVQSKAWPRVAALSDPEFLARFREQQLVYAEAEKIARQNRKSKKEQYGLPKCVQKYFESQESHFTESFLKGFAGVKSVEQLAQLTPAALFASWLAGSEKVEKSDENKALPPTTRTILGDVVEGDSLAHVIYRVVPTPPTEPQKTVEMIDVRHVDGSWRIVPNDDVRLAGRTYSWVGRK